MVPVRSIPERRDVQCDELWSLVYAKDRNKDDAEPWDEAGSAWAFMAIDSDSKLLLAHHVSMRRDARAATRIMKDFDSRLESMPNISADMLEAYSIAADRVFGRRMRLNRSKSDTSHVERHNLAIRMCNRRYTRKTIAFSKKRERQVAMMNLFAVHYTFLAHSPDASRVPPISCTR